MTFGGRLAKATWKKSSKARTKTKRKKKLVQSKSAKQTSSQSPDFTPPTGMITEFTISELVEFCLPQDDYHDFQRHSQSIDAGGDIYYPTYCKNSHDELKFRRKAQNYAFDPKKQLLLHLKITRKALKTKMCYDASTIPKANISEEERDYKEIKASKIINWRKYGADSFDNQWKAGEYKEEVETRIVVKPEMIPRIWHDYHELLGCFGNEKTAGSIKRLYWLPRLTEFVTYAKKISPCCQNKTGPPKQSAAPLRPLAVTSTKFARVHLDFCGAFPVSYKGNKYVLIAVDSLTRFTEVVALPDQSAEHVTQFIFDQLICRYGVTKIIVHDNGKPFIAEYNKVLLEKYGIQRALCRPYHPETNGMAESAVKQIKNGIHHRITVSYIRQGTVPASKSGKITWGPDWDQKLFPAAFGIRASYTDTRKMCPIKALYGRDPLLIGDWNALGDSEDEAEQDSDEEFDADEHQKKLDEYVIELMVNYKAFQRKMAEKYNRRRQANFIPKVGDKVRFKKITGVKKVDKKKDVLYPGPNDYVIVKRVTPTGTVALETRDGTEIKQHYPWDYIFPWNTAEDLKKQKEKKALQSAKEEVSNFCEASVELADVVSEEEQELISFINTTKEEFQRWIPEAHISEDVLVKIMNATDWIYTKNGTCFCAFITVITTMGTTPQMITFFRNWKADSTSEYFLKTIILMMNSAINYSIDNKQNKSTSEHCYGLIIAMIEKWLLFKRQVVGNFYTLRQALEILGFYTLRLKMDLARHDLLSAKEIRLSCCTAKDCGDIYESESSKEYRLGSWKNWTSDHLKSQVTPEQLISVEADGYLFSVTSLLCGGRPQGKCEECSGTNFTLRFSEPVGLILVSLCSSMNFCGGFDFEQLKDVPLIDHQGKIHRYHATVILMNPGSNHWVPVHVDWTKNRFVELESLRKKHTHLPGKPKFHDLRWMKKNKKDVGAILLKKKSQEPTGQNMPYDLAVSSLKDYKLTQRDVKKFNKRILGKMMEFRGIWYLFDGYVTTRTFYATKHVEIDGVAYTAGDKLPYTQQQLRNMKSIIPSSSYRNDYASHESKIRDVLMTWCDRFEADWIHTQCMPEDSALQVFKQELVDKWREQHEAAVVPVELKIYSTDEESEEQSEAESVSERETKIQEIITAKKLRIIGKTDRSVLLEGTVAAKARDSVKMMASKESLAFFKQEGWFATALRPNCRTRLGFVEPGKTRLELRCRSYVQVHTITHLELIFKPSKTDQAIFRNTSSNLLDAAKYPIFFKITCDPIPVEAFAKGTTKQH